MIKFPTPLFRKVSSFLSKTKNSVITIEVIPVIAQS